jgi:N-acetylglucosaminyldiphosphoundecaprenol N-acetyl-beta-D-mannosaminyltransferase
MFGRTLPERVAGVDLFQSLCAGAASANLKVFFLGGQVGSADLAAARLRERVPGLDVETYCPPMGFENDPAELKHIAELIQKAQPRIVFVGLGAPKQERWIYEHGRKLGVNVYMGVGGSFEMVGGVVPRAPAWIQNIGCEWLYRLCREPRRMWRRYLIGNLHFIAIVVSQRVRRILLGVLVRVLKNSSFEAELQDATVRSELLDIMRRFAAVEQTPSK